MNRRARVLARGSLLGLIFALLVAAVPTFLDWRRNPGGIFRGGSGTDWGVVFETFFSWLWPAILVAVPMSIVVLAVIAARKSGNAT